MPAANQPSTAAEPEAEGDPGAKRPKIVKKVGKVCMGGAFGACEQRIGRMGPGHACDILGSWDLACFVSCLECSASACLKI